MHTTRGEALAASLLELLRRCSDCPCSPCTAYCLILPFVPLALWCPRKYFCAQKRTTGGRALVFIRPFPWFRQTARHSECIISFIIPILWTIKLRVLERNGLAQGDRADEQESQITAHNSCLQNLPFTGRCVWAMQRGPNRGISNARGLGFILMPWEAIRSVCSLKRHDQMCVLGS